MDWLVVELCKHTGHVIQRRTEVVQDLTDQDAGACWGFITERGIDQHVIRLGVKIQADTVAFIGEERVIQLAEFFGGLQASIEFFDNARERVSAFNPRITHCHYLVDLSRTTGKVARTFYTPPEQETLDLANVTFVLRDEIVESDLVVTPENDLQALGILALAGALSPGGQDDLLRERHRRDDTTSRAPGDAP